MHYFLSVKFADLPLYSSAQENGVMQWDTSSRLSESDKVSAGRHADHVGEDSKLSQNMERLLVGTLLQETDTSVRPIINSSQPLNVTFGLALTQIIDVVSLERECTCF